MPTTYFVRVAYGPFGQVFQAWATPDGIFPSAVATDFPDPDRTTECVVMQTSSVVQAEATLSQWIRRLCTEADARGVGVHHYTPRFPPDTDQPGAPAGGATSGQRRAARGGGAGT